MKLKKLLGLLALIPALAFPGVNLKNGNFYMSYTDIVVPGGGQDLEVTRTYNSKSTDKGWFGFGWGSDYETYLSVAPDGSVVVYENGAGAQTRFTPKEQVNAEAASRKVVDAMRKKSPMADNVGEELVKKLTKDAELRQAYAKKFDVTSKISDGSVLYSNQRGIQEVHKVKDGYVRKFNDGKKQFFNANGKMTKVSDKNGYEIVMAYNKDGRLESIKDSQAKQLFFSWYSEGKIQSVWSAGDKKATYVFKGDDLTESKDVSGNVYKFDYDANHNMTSVNYVDNSKMVIKYAPKTQFVTEIVARNGESTEYKYGSNPKNPDLHYWTDVTKTIAGKSSENRYEYEIKARDDGSQYTYRIVTVVDGLKTDTIYSECCGLPIKITNGKDVTNFEYNAKGLLTKKTSTKGEYVELSYHQEFNKITKVVNSNGWTEFSYDKSANLNKAWSSEGKSVVLFYDLKGRITKMLDKEKQGSSRTLTFKYNSLGKPVEISMEGMGSINVAYDNYGEIKKVESKEGHKMAIQVTSAFQSLLSIVKPAGVNLNM